MNSMHVSMGQAPLLKLNGVSVRLRSWEEQSYRQHSKIARQQDRATKFRLPEACDTQAAASVCSRPRIRLQQLSLRRYERRC